MRMYSIHEDFEIDCYVVLYGNELTPANQHEQVGRITKGDYVVYTGRHMSAKTRLVCEPNLEAGYKALVKWHTLVILDR